MKKIICLEDLDFSNYFSSLGKVHLSAEFSQAVQLDPLTFTTYFKTYFEKNYPSTVEEIRAAIKFDAGIIHLKNVKEKSYDVLTPYSGQVKTEGLEELICQMYGIIGVINTHPILYKDENGSVLRAVAQRYNSHHECSSQSAFKNLDWHVDGAYRPITERIEDFGLSPMPDYLVFGIVHKGPQCLPITCISLKDILNELSHEDVLDGLKSEFTVTSSDSFSNKVSSKNVPLLIKNRQDSFYNRIAFQYAKPLTKRAASFLGKIKEIADQERLHNVIQVEAGDIVVLNNKTVLHKRSHYEPTWDGKDRYFIRIYSVKYLNFGVLSDKSKPWIWN